MWRARCWHDLSVRVRPPLCLSRHLRLTATRPLLLLLLLLVAVFAVIDWCTTATSQFIIITTNAHSGRQAAPPDVIHSFLVATRSLRWHIHRDPVQYRSYPAYYPDDCLSLWWLFYTPVDAAVTKAELRSVIGYWLPARQPCWRSGYCLHRRLSVCQSVCVSVCQCKTQKTTDQKLM